MVEKANDSSTRFDGDAARWSERGGTPGFAGFHEPVLSRPHDGELRARVMELETELAGLKSDLARMRSSVVQAIAATTMRHAPATEEFRPAFAGRLAALASSQDVLIRGNWNDAPLAGAIEAVLDGFGESGRITLDGPAVTLFADTVVTVSMAFHELATNAVKHGALSAPGGRVQVTWTTSRTPPSIVEILWRERGGPMVTPPSRRGFGSQLLEQGMPRGGTVKLDYRPEGLECRICLPLGRGSRQNGH